MTQSAERELVLAMPDLRIRTLKLLQFVRYPLPEEQEVLERKLGHVVLPMRARSVGLVVAENPDYFWDLEPEYLKWRSDLRDYTPPAIVIAMNPDPEGIALQNSYGLSQAEQLVMIEEYSQASIEKELPDAKAIMLPATGYAQADHGYYLRPETGGQRLLRNIYARALDMTTLQSSVFVGRNESAEPLKVCAFEAFNFPGLAVPAIVFLQK